MSSQAFWDETPGFWDEAKKGPLFISVNVCYNDYRIAKTIVLDFNQGTVLRLTAQSENRPLIETLLLPERFLPCARGTLINITNVTAISHTEATLRGGLRVKISKQYFDAVYEAFNALN